MILQFNVVSAAKCPPKDVIEALDIYCKTVDPGSLTDTNQIKDYIWNNKAHSNEKRIMFFYLFYDINRVVTGFSEFAYLPENRVLVIDYICTKQRNHVLFYNFYHMALQEITEELKRKGLFIRYILTELSLSQVDGILSDPDSNYFRHLLANEGFVLSKYPYYQPPLLRCEEVMEFNLAIKLVSVDNAELFLLDKRLYLSIVRELYISHYYAWYQSFAGGQGIGKIIELLPARIEREIPQNEKCVPISLVQCRLFEEGQCPKITSENITLPRMRKNRWKSFYFIAIWIILTIATFVICVIPECSSLETIISSFLTIVAGIISIVSFRKEIFPPK